MARKGSTSPCSTGATITSSSHSCTEVATGILSEGEIAIPLRQVVRRSPNVKVELAEVTGFDLEARIVHAKSPFHDPVEVPYDSLIVAAGVNQSYFGHDDLALLAPGMKTLDERSNSGAASLGPLKWPR